jgi:hypothetical protein
MTRPSLEHPTNVEMADRLFLLPENVELPFTLAFQTADHDRGLLQITGFTDNPHGVKIRYKLVEGNNSQSSSNPNFGPAKIYSAQGKVVLETPQATITADSIFFGSNQTMTVTGRTMVIRAVQEQTDVVAAATDSARLLAEQPPVVVETFPVSGARDVPPGEAEIRVRYSKPMADGLWSWSSAWENSTPESVGEPHYLDDHRTCTLKVRLEPGKTYGWWLNSDKFQKFTGDNGRPAVPYLLIFQTAEN